MKARIERIDYVIFLNHVNLTKRLNAHKISSFWHRKLGKSSFNIIFVEPTNILNRLRSF